jgi:nitrous oxide reductase accessory protein NosL
MQKILTRRAFFALPLVLGTLSACKKDPSTAPSSATTGRCSNCGMKLTADSPWLAELVAEDGTKLTFDTPRCALTASLAGKKGKLRVQDYYDRKWRDAAEVRFVTGSSVLGPMGPDLVPVDVARAPKFVQDHQGEKTLKLEEISKAVLEDLK